jgi:hypothetical protein
MIRPFRNSQSLRSAASAALLAMVMIPLNASAANWFTEAFTGGKGQAKFRYRLENVDQANFDNDALASTLRARLNFQTADTNAISLFAEFDYVGELLANSYNAGAGNTPDRTQYPVVADPEGPDLNQAFLQYKNGGNQFRVGRQRITYDNHRFIGSVGWRQNEQTYDAVTYRFKKNGLDIQAAYIGQVNRIFGKDVPAGTHDTDIWTGNIGKSWDGVGKLSGYYYDIDNLDAAAFSTSTYGARFAGRRKIGSPNLGYTFEYARQTDAHNNPVDYSASYYRIDLSLAFDNITPYFGYESLGGDDQRSGASFRTPLATLHAFNGWADQFLVTPDAGLQDIFGGLKGKVGSWSWNVLYHDFQAESGSEKFGKEVDGSISRKFAKHYGLLFKAAWFDASSESKVDVTKFWVQLTADF